jgi:hypothetical protein
MTTKIPCYRIHIKGQLGPEWSLWFDDLTTTSLEDGTTVLSGPVPDQACLHGILNRIRDLNLPLISLYELDPDNQKMKITNDRSE